LLETDSTVEKQRELRREFSDRGEILRLMLPPSLSGKETLDWQFHPLTIWAGMGWDTRRINDDLLAITFWTSTGHGLGSACWR